MGVSFGVSDHMRIQATSTGHSLQEMSSIERFLTACTVPLIYQGVDKVRVQGTGTFFEQDGRHFLVTAGHVFKGIDPNELGVPERAGNDAYIWRFGHAQIHHPKNTDELDVGVVELGDKEFIELAVAGWRFLNASNLAPPVSNIEQYIVAGYPDKTVKNIDGTLTPAALFQIYTGPFDGEPRDGRGKFDLLLRYDRKAGNTYGRRKQTPSLEGVSGAAVYAVLPSKDGIWAPEIILKVVGIQTSFVHSEYIRAKSWGLVANLLSQIPTV